jgi:DNA-binding NarL/FixJ family response regulator
MSTTLHKMITVVIADDHQLFRQSLSKLLEGSAEFRVVGEAATGLEAIRMASDLRPDILLLDKVMPGISGLAALRELAKLTPPVPTLLLTADVCDAEIMQALQLGARGVLLKQTTSEMLFRCIRAIVAGEYWVGRECVGEIVARMRERAFPAAAPPRYPTFDFTSRQLEIVSALVAGATNQHIAKQFSISATTVKYHLSHMFEKAGVSNRVELALLFAGRHGVDPAVNQREPA